MDSRSNVLVRLGTLRKAAKASNGRSRVWEVTTFWAAASNGDFGFVVSLPRSFLSSAPFLFSELGVSENVDVLGLALNFDSLSADSLTVSSEGGGDSSMANDVVLDVGPRPRGDMGKPLLVACPRGL